MSPAHPLPGTFEEAIKMSAIILGTSPTLAERGTIETESEQLVIGAYRRSSGRGRTFGRNDLYVRVMDPFPKEAGELLVAMSNRRARGEPLQYLLGYQYFLNHEYEVEPSVLIPRPETEILVYEVVQTFKRLFEQPRLGIEIGIGSGCISIELLKLFPTLTMIGTDASPEAAGVAAKNATKILGAKYDEQFDIRLTGTPQEVLEPVEDAPWLRGGRADFIVSNPPYVVGPAEVDADVLAHEPKEALFAPDGDPLYFYRKIIDGAEAFLKPSGYVFFECPHERIDRIGGLFGAHWKVDGFRDLNDRPRVLRAEWKGISVLN
jgi:release factor glutamine methyltransferase